MLIEKMIDQIVSIKDNAESFTTKDGDDEIWRADIKVCEEMIAILSAFQDTGTATTEEAAARVNVDTKRRAEMRKIIFRGKRKANGKWVIGSYVKYSTVPAQRNESYIFETHTNVEHNIIPETVGQYTGLKDENDVEIYEGDICRFAVFDFNGIDTQYTGVVVYDGSRFMLWKYPDNEYYGADGGFDLDLVVYQEDSIEVIGNIHDNPELLEGGGENNG